MIVVNFKNYKSGKENLKLAKQIKQILQKNFIVCPPNSDLSLIATNIKIPVYAQHVELKESSRATGYNIVSQLKQAGVKGTILNHSEHRLEIYDIIQTIKLCKKEGLEVILCAKSLKEVHKFLKMGLKPTAIAFEDPKLVGSGKSITQYKSKDVELFAKMLHGSRILALCGAGVSSSEDVSKAEELGCDGVLIASAIAKVKNPSKLLKEIKEVTKRK